MSSTAVVLDADEINDVFPFHVAFDREFRIVSAGGAWARVCPQVAPGGAFRDLFEIVRPAMTLDFGQLAMQSGRALVLECAPIGLTLRGQVRCRRGGDRALFLGAPWVRALDDLARIGLTLDDLPAHESTSDYLLLIQSQRQALQDVRNLSFDIERREAMLRAVFDHAADGIIVMSPDGVVRGFNAAAARIFGYAPSEVIGQNVAMLMPMSLAKRHDGLVRTYLETGEAHIVGSSREVEGLRRDGTAVALELSVSEVNVGDDHLFTGILRDLSERTRLRAAEERLYKTLQSLHAAAWDIDLRTNTSFWTEQGFTLLGVDAGETPTFERFLAAVHPDDRPLVLGTTERALAGAGPLEVKYRVTRADGQIRWFESIGTVVRDTDGQPIRLSGIAVDITEQRQRDAKLAQTEANFRSTLVALKAGTWSFDLRTGDGFWSDENCDLMGVPRGTRPTSELFVSCIHPDDAARSREVMRRALAGEGPLEGEDRVILPDGAIRWIQSIGVVLRNEQGVAVGISGISVDVSERHRAEESAQEARELGERRSIAQRQVAQVLAAAMTASEAIQGTLRVIGQTLGWHFGAGWLLDPELDRLVCCCSWVGGSEEQGSRLRALRRTSCARGEGLAGGVWETGGLRFLRLDEPGMAARSNRAAAAVELGLRTAVGAPIVRDGAVVGVLEFACVEADDLDPALRNLFDTVGSQLGESLSRLEVVDALRASERQLRGVIDASLDAVISIDAIGRIVDWNPQAERIFGWSAGDAIGQSIQELIIPEEMREAHRRGMAHYHATGQGPALNQRLELEALHRDGHRFPIEIAIATLHPWSADGRPPGLERRGAAFSAFVRDISDRRRAEAALRAAKEEAERSAQARSDFLATMSHEIRTPLNGVIGMLNLALKQDIPEAPREQLDVARRSADMLLAVTNDVLDLSKIEAGRMALDEAPVDLLALADDVIATARPLAAEGVTVSASFSGGSAVRVLGDALRIRQILANLVGNAVKFTPSGRVLLSVHVPADGTARYRFAVEDTGIGIPADRHASIFEVFTQAGRSTSRRYGGTGLGLPISSRFASLMGGTLRLAHSSPDGSRFELELPLHPAPHDVAADADTGDLPLGVAGRVLVVDDNPVNRTIAAAMLAQLGCEVVVCGGGPAALEQIVASSWNLVFMDCEMPDMDGYETTRRVRAAGFGAEALPIVAMTASALPQDRARALEAGMNDHLTKPLLEAPLARMLVKWLTGAPASSGTPTAANADTVALSDEDHEKIRKTRALISTTPGAWEEIVRAFLTHWTTSRAAMTEAADAREWMSLCKIAHDVKGMSGMLGAGRLARLAGEIERAAHHQLPEGVALLPTLDREFEAVRDVVTGTKDA